MPNIEDDYWGWVKEAVSEIMAARPTNTRRKSMKEKRVRVLRIIEYTGTREAIESTLSQGIKGIKRFTGRQYGELVIRSAVLGEYPEILESLPEEKQDAD
tara:strand:+ start:248 stop:547 length:300 start_codon:yes stop_codon:yes gene_type:complete